jgi:hypothetical protein
VVGPHGTADDAIVTCEEAALNPQGQWVESYYVSRLAAGNSNWGIPVLLTGDFLTGGIFAAGIDREILELAMEKDETIEIHLSVKPPSGPMPTSRISALPRGPLAGLISSGRLAAGDRLIFSQPRRPHARRTTHGRRRGRGVTDDRKEPAGHETGGLLARHRAPGAQGRAMRPARAPEFRDW